MLGDLLNCCKPVSAMAHRQFGSAWIYSRAVYYVAWKEFCIVRNAVSVYSAWPFLLPLSLNVILLIVYSVVQ